jgi:hypothetical protein
MALNRQAEAGPVGAARGPLHVGHNEEDPLGAVKVATYGTGVALLDTLNAGYSHLGCVLAIRSRLRQRVSAPRRRRATTHHRSRIGKRLSSTLPCFRRWLFALLASPPLALLSLHIDLQARDPRSTSALAVYSLAAFSGFFWLQALQHAVGRLSFLPAGAFAETLLLPEPTTYALRRWRDALWPFTISFASVAPVVMAHESDRLLLLAVGACFLAAHSALGSLIAAERSRLKAAKADRLHLETEGKKTVKAANELQDKLAEAEAAKSRADKESAAATAAKVKA